MPGYFWSDLGDMIRSTLVRREEDNDIDISDGEWAAWYGSRDQEEMVGVNGSNAEELLREIRLELFNGGPLAAAAAADGRRQQGGVEGVDQCMPPGVEFLPGCEVLEWENVEGVIKGWVSESCHVPPHIHSQHTYLPHHPPSSLPFVSYCFVDRWYVSISDTTRNRERMVCGKIHDLHAIFTIFNGLFAK